MDLEHTAIMRLQEASKLSEFYYQKPLLLTYSGGKDSEVCLELCRRAGVPFEVIHNHTTADAPETVYHVRKVFRKLELEGVKCEILHPLYKGHLTSMWALIIKEMYPPTRKVRYCCRYLKERTISRCCAVLGVRRSESPKRAASGVAEKRSSRNEVHYQKLINRYGEKIVDQATIFCSFSEAISTDYASDPIFQEVVKEIESVIDKGRNQEYAQKVARYELRESFECLIRNIQ